MSKLKTVAFASAMLLGAGFLQAGEAGHWQVKPISHSTGYTVAGQHQSQHEFGLLKHSNICSSDELYLTLSSQHSNIWSLSGQRVTIEADFDGVSLDMPLEVVSIQEQGKNRHLVMFAHVYANDAVIELIADSENLTVSLPADRPELVELFGNAREQFSVAGFRQARAQAAARCGGMSDQLAAADM